MMPGRSDEPAQPSSGGTTPRSAEASPTSAGPDCRTCELRARCISYGWMSPGGVWFENAVMLRPKPGCRGFIGRGDDIRAHFSAVRPVERGH
ncbi:hypothetical protein [Pinisolibacter aquiterrae]|uniref:hypothetical protein n=1 Tax=Pinisolibacter aquiterrae TaxID=2815579 RepID=UPI001C3E0A8B|nr:hypothetical protein [Pinisolibacter aquiterrae]MBV5265008.1 hypothetical protein [Pinisolibacter aquiterrae]MCC8235610.1 hypothetical protein [Pinisolibacter aquiterrae]